jgi:hypothetical protein
MVAMGTPNAGPSQIGTGCGSKHPCFPGDFGAIVCLAGAVTQVTIQGMILEGYRCANERLMFLR